MSQDTDAYMAKVIFFLFLGFVAACLTGLADLGMLVVMAAVIAGLLWFFSYFVD